MPQRALLADYNCVLARRAKFAKLESDAHRLIGLYGALCRSRGLPRTPQPLQRLKEYAPQKTGSVRGVPHRVRKSNQFPVVVEWACPAVLDHLRAQRGIARTYQQQAVAVAAGRTSAVMASVLHLPDQKAALGHGFKY